MRKIKDHLINFILILKGYKQCENCKGLYHPDGTNYCVMCGTKTMTASKKIKNKEVMLNEQKKNT